MWIQTGTDIQLFWQENCQGNDAVMFGHRITEVEGSTS